MISKKDQNAIAEIIKGNLRETYWLHLLVNSLADYFTREYGQDMSFFKKTCLNGEVKEVPKEEPSSPTIESELKTEPLKTESGPDIRKIIREANDAMTRLPDLVSGKSRS